MKILIVPNIFEMPLILNNVAFHILVSSYINSVTKCE